MVVTSGVPISPKYAQIKDIVGKRELWVASSCSLLHSPIDLSVETRLDAEVKSWFAFALQKCEELALLRDALNSGDTAAITHWSAPIRARRHSTRVHNPAVEKRLAAITARDSQRQSPYEVRAEAQRARFNLPAWPTTTIGSFPQTTEIRGLRPDFKRAIWMRITTAPALRNTSNRRSSSRNVWVWTCWCTARPSVTIWWNTSVNTDGFVFTQNGWVQSYGSRCVKPPVVIGDVSRPEAITVEWAKYAQSLTDKPVKGMLTGPVTILCWSFPREDVSRKPSPNRSPALRDEVADLEAAGIGIIQIDEPALREGLPLRRSDWDAYSGAWRLSASTRPSRRTTRRSTPTCVTANLTTAWTPLPRSTPM